MPDATIAIVFGTRPELVKLARLTRLLGPRARTVHTGQHFSANLSDRFLTELGLGRPAVQLAVGGASRGRQIGEAVAGLDEHFASDPPAAVVVQGDTSTALAGAIAANARDIPIVHVEAGLRSFDRAMPEEHNRVVVDHLGDLLLAPTEVSRDHLLREGIAESRVRVTGNTAVDAVHDMLPDGPTRLALLARFGVEADAFVLSTFHRPENVDDRDTLATVLRELGGIGLPVVLPLHPRTVARVEALGLGGLLAGLHVTEPLGYSEFLGLARECAFLVSDSGGVQEESSVLKRPVIVVRRSTERPEVLGTFCELVPPGPRVGELAREWARDPQALHAALEPLPSPYGAGDAAERCRDAIVALLEGS